MNRLKKLNFILIDKVLFIDYYLFFIFDKLLFSKPVSIFTHHTSCRNIHVAWLLKGENVLDFFFVWGCICLLYTSPSPRDLSTSRMPSSA